MRTVKISLLDAFTRERYCGNVAGVILDASNLTSREMQIIATELNAPTSGFVTSPRERPETFDVRFFTPRKEIDLCGHVTIATSYQLALEGRIFPKAASVVFQTKAGSIPIEVCFVEEKPSYAMMALKKPNFYSVRKDHSFIADFLEISSSNLSKEYPCEIAYTGLRHLLVPIRNVDVVKNMKPSFQKLIELSSALKVETVAVFCLEALHHDYDAHMRDFCAAVGDYEEAASGTTCSALASYLVRHGIVKPRRNLAKITIEQGIEMNRFSTIIAEVWTNRSFIEKVGVGGSAVPVFSGELILDP